MVYSHNGCFVSNKRNEALVSASGLDLENMRLREGNQSLKITKCTMPFMEMSRAGNSRDKKVGE